MNILPKGTDQAGNPVLTKEQTNGLSDIRVAYRSDKCMYVDAFDVILSVSGRDFGWRIWGDMDKETKDTLEVMMLPFKRLVGDLVTKSKDRFCVSYPIGYNRLVEWLKEKYWARANITPVDEPVHKKQKLEPDVSQDKLDFLMKNEDFLHFVRQWAAWAATDPVLAITQDSILRSKKKLSNIRGQITESENSLKDLDQQISALKVERDLVLQSVLSTREQITSEYMKLESAAIWLEKEKMKWLQTQRETVLNVLEHLYEPKKDYFTNDIGSMAFVDFVKWKKQKDCLRQGIAEELEQKMRLKNVSKNLSSRAKRIHDLLVKENLLRGSLAVISIINSSIVNANVSSPEQDTEAHAKQWFGDIVDQVNKYYMETDRDEVLEALRGTKWAYYHSPKWGKEIQVTVNVVQDIYDAVFLTCKGTMARLLCLRNMFQIECDISDLTEDSEENCKAFLERMWRQVRPHPNLVLVNNMEMVMKVGYQPSQNWSPDMKLPTMVLCS